MLSRTKMFMLDNRKKTAIRLQRHTDRQVVCVWMSYLLTAVPLLFREPDAEETDRQSDRQVVCVSLQRTKLRGGNTHTGWQRWTDRQVMCVSVSYLPIAVRLSAAPPCFRSLMGCGGALLVHAGRGSCCWHGNLLHRCFVTQETAKMKYYYCIMETSICGIVVLQHLSTAVFIAVKRSEY